MPTPKIYRLILFTLLLLAIPMAAQDEIPVLEAESFQNDGIVELNKYKWRYKLGDDPGWAARDFDDGAWQRQDGTMLSAPALYDAGWNGRAWFRLRLKTGESITNRQLAFAMTLKGAAEVYIDGAKSIDFGKLSDGEIVEDNPNKLPLPFSFGDAGEHVIAVRFASESFADMSDWTARWMVNGGVFPGFSMIIRDAPDTYQLINYYAASSSMRIGAFFVGILLALALLHFLLYLFYRVERANLFYSIYAVSFAVFLVTNNLIFFGHLTVHQAVAGSLISGASLAAFFLALLAFLHIAFDYRLGKAFWILTALWSCFFLARVIQLNSIGNLGILNPILVGLSFTFCFWLLVKALRQSRPGSWILMGGMQVLAFGMFSTLINQFGWIDLPPDIYILGEIGIVLGVPVAVSIFLARSFARTNRNLSVQLANVETLSAQKIEQEKNAAELRAENERRAKELEEAKQLQLSMLPKKLPNIANLEIAAYMKPATEVGGDYYDFHVGEDGTLTVAVGDATGHGLKAGSVVTATKSLFNAFAAEENIPRILKQSSLALKKMNLRGLFMAMALLKIKNGKMTLCVAGMPSVLIYRAAGGWVEEISIRAMPLGSITKTVYAEHEVALDEGDCVVLMSDGFPEMFNHSGEMLGFNKAAEVLPNVSNLSSQEIIDHLVKTGEDWANGRPADDDVTFVVLKII